MVFSSLEFVFFFLPIAIIGDFLLKKWIPVRNLFLLIASLFFYAWGEPQLVFLFAGTILINWLAGLFAKKRRWVGIIAIILDIGVLFIFKYLNWSVDILNASFNAGISIKQIALPIGISFYTFQAISYVVDVMSGKTEANRNPISVGLYIAFFPQLIAGPIVRYTDIEKQLKNRTVTMSSFSDGVMRFLAGFSKKIILADGMAVIVDKAYGILETGSLGAGFAWLGAVAYMFQIFLDFSAYSDMAIGLGAMYGFRIPENFNKPYMAKSIRDFWRRWHISLSIWFRDYVYIPLGGNRNGRTYFNIAVVWLLTGLWHGASLNFVLWGCIYGLLVMAEKALHIEERLNGKGLAIWFYRAFSLLCILFLWIIFRAENLTMAIQYIKSMFNFGVVNIGRDSPWMYFWEMKFELLACALLSFVRLPEKIRENGWYQGIKAVVLLLLFFVSVSYLVKGNFSPFLYFNF